MDNLLYYSFSAAIISIITFGAYNFLENGSKTKSFRFPIAFIIWQVTLGLIASTNFFESFDLPPRFVLFGIVPSFIILALFSYSKSTKSLIQNIPLQLPIFFQSFRIFVELLILKAFLDGYAPVSTTFQGYNYEFYFGISAIIVGFSVLKLKLNYTILLLWNILGLIMLGIIVFIFASSGYAHQAIWDSPIPLVKMELFHMPHLSIATLYMPLAVWMHIFSIRQIRAKKKR